MEDPRVKPRRRGLLGRSLVVVSLHWAPCNRAALRTYVLTLLCQGFRYHLSSADCSL
ncbi:hypothetical protein N9996_00055 [Synechococcus sp. AH-603-M21]|nr:hypothetical protein [Synechococcus sp. AH-603-M21]